MQTNATVKFLMPDAVIQVLSACSYDEGGELFPEDAPVVVLVSYSSLSSRF